MYLEIFVFFLIVSFIYSSVGFGGGSSYLAILAMYSLPHQEIRLIALICNIIVVVGSVYIYVKNKQTDWKKILPITIVSVPMAYLGAIVKISQSTFFMMLGVSLIIAAVLLWIKIDGSAETPAKDQKSDIVKNSFLGGGIGFLSGMVGIGGGIFLSPILNLMKWDVPKKIAATASVFILANSIAGISGQLTQLSGNMLNMKILYPCLSVFIGGQLGSRISVRWNPIVIKRVTAVLVFSAGINILIKHWNHIY
ncbi:sulfite exporter TauE/SafE family protein [Chryseobacterium sp. ERMR1:04]|uniref:sulfite exporter TauE/SafE family protein n=1 Tax=Chryseobacterium sp. ERMR1:04 TaxID=1705393 RepID=UPI0006C8B583|nr:sulfite exporter TauE/SafE family protein [Chryseobacterium sp. ERMR1:04]